MVDRLRRVLVALALAAATALAAIVIVALAPPGAPEPGGSLAPTAASGECVPAFRRRAAEVARSTWFTFRERSDSNGSLTGYVLRVAQSDSGAMAGVELPPEAFADGPYDGGALVGSDDGAESTLRFVAPGTCGRTLLRTAEVVLRRATITPDGRNLITFRLARATRADEGIWIAPIQDPGQARELLPPLPPADGFGVTYATSMRWAEDRTRLLVESCGQSECRYRVVDPATGEVITIEDRGYDEAIGLFGDHLYLVSACGARPCPLVERNIRTGATRELLPGVVSATLVSRGARAWLAARVYAGPTLGVTVVDLVSRRSRPLTLPAIASGLALVVGGHGGSAGLPDGWIALAPEGVLPDPIGGGRLLALDVETSRLVTLLGGRP